MSNELDSKVIKELYKQAKEKYPVSIQYKGRLTIEELEELEKYCDVHAFSVYMNGTVVYSIRYRKEQIWQV